MKTLLEFLRLKVIEIGKGLWECIKCMGFFLIVFVIVTSGFFAIGCIVSCFISIECSVWWLNEVRVGVLVFGVFLTLFIIIVLMSVFFNWIKENWQEAKYNVQNRMEKEE